MSDLDDTDRPDEAREEPGPGDADTAVAEADAATRAPMWVIHALVVFGALLGVVSSVEVWAQRQLLDTDEWVELADDLLADDQIRGELAEFLVDELYASVDVSSELETRLPESVNGLAGIVASALREPVTDGVDRVLAADATREAWRTANRVAHEALVSVLREESTATISTADGAITLDLVELVRRVGQEFGLSGDVLDRLPDDVGRITIVESDELGAAQDAIRLLDTLGAVLYVLVLGCFVAAIVLAGSRRREVVGEVGAAIAIASFLILVVVRVVVRTVENAGRGDAAAALRSASTLSTELLRGIALVGLAYGILLIAYAVIAGPSSVATRVRARVAPVVVPRPALAVAGALVILLLVVYLLPSTPFGSWWRGLVFLGAFAAIMVALWRQMAAERPVHHGAPDPAP